MYRRKLRRDDYPAVKEIFKTSFNTSIHPLSDLHISWTSRSVDDSYGFFDSGKLIGFYIASYHKNNGSNMYIDYTAVRQEYRGNGLGSHILQSLLKEVFVNRRSIHLYPENDRVAEWYSRHGFHKTHGGYYCFHSYDTRNRLLNFKR
jgi:ribosomal protein S18 acetylase RimI-like enzyme